MYVIWTILDTPTNAYIIVLLKTVSWIRQLEGTSLKHKGSIQILIIQDLKPTLKEQTDLIRAKMFNFH